MRALAHRMLGLGDIDTLLAMNPGIDVSRALATAREVAIARSAPELIEDLERIVRGRRASR